MDYEFKSEFNFIESGNLKDDIFVVIKSELSVFLHEKYKIYLDCFCEEEDIKIAKYYSEYYQLLNRLSIVLKDKTITNLNDYVYSYSAMSKGNTVNNSELNTFLTVLREFNTLINLFCYDIITSVRSKNVSIKSRSVFSIIRNYFKEHKEKSFEALLESLYNITYRNMRLKYKENKYGKK